MDLTEFQQRAVALGVVKMLTNTSFSICDLDAIAKTMGRVSNMSGPDYQALRTLHCVDWGTMGPELARMTREKCLELLGLPPQTIDAIAPNPGVPKEPPAEALRRMRLAFWKKEG